MKKELNVCRALQLKFWISFPAAFVLGNEMGLSSYEIKLLCEFFLLQKTEVFSYLK